MITVNKRISKTLDLAHYCHHAKPHDFMEVTEWINGEGVDVYLSTRGDQRISLTLGEWDALQALVAYRSAETR